MQHQSAARFIGWSMITLISGVALTSVRAAPATQSSDEADKLVLAPPAAAPDDATVESLTEKAWELRGPVNILGVGHVQTLQFARDPNGSLQVSRVDHVSPNVNRPDQAVPDRAEATRCDITGVVLSHGPERQSFVVRKGEALVLNALVPLGNRKWYYTSRFVDSKGKPGAQEEYLFDFADDPCKADNGSATLQIRQNNFPPKTIKAHFVLEQADNGCRYFDLLRDDGNTRLTSIGIRSDGTYGVMTDNLNLNSKVYLAVAAKK